ncbi:hypothetical protein RhiirA4_479417, partial [Rhizophagus irregularis]
AEYSFSTSAKVSPILKAEAEYILWKRHKEAEKAYKQAANICKKAERALGQDGRNLKKLADKLTKVNQGKYTRLKKW